MMNHRVGHLEPGIVTVHRVLDSLAGAGLLLGLSSIFGVYNYAYLLIGVLIFFMSLVILHGMGVYHSRWIDSRLFEVNRICSGCFWVYFLLLTIGYFMKAGHELSRVVILLWMGAWPSLLIAERLALRSYFRHKRRKGQNVRGCVIAGAGDLGRRLGRWLEANPWMGVKILGYFDDKAAGEVDGHPVLGNIESLPSVIAPMPVEMVYLALPMRAESKLRKVVERLTDSVVSVYIVPDVFIFDLIVGGNITFLDGLPIVSLLDSPIHGLNALLKRLEDIILSSIILVTALPLMVIIAIVIKLTSKGPVFFKQWRYGLNGDQILIYKFRTMTVCEDGFVFKQVKQCDPRVTAFGSFLRKTSLDELPQFINVLQGRMSLVGPRPHPVAMNEAFRKLVPGYMLRHIVKPGITGLAQVNGCRGETETLDKMKKRIKYDLEYLWSWSILLDFKIICRTMVICLKRENAY